MEYTLLCGGKMNFVFSERAVKQLIHFDINLKHKRGNNYEENYSDWVSRKWQEHVL